MRSKTLCFNKTLFRKNLSRFWPLWAVPSFVGALFPLAMLTQLLRYGAEGFFGYGPESYALEFTGTYYDVVSSILPILSLCYAVLVALAVWSYLFHPRSVSLMHTLPIPREGLFLTNFLSGMAMMLVPYVVTGVLSIAVSILFGFFEPVGPLVTILAVLGDSLFYFCSATAAAFVTGNLFALPVLYFIFHFLAVGMEALVSTFASGFLLGLEGNYPGTVEFLSPTVYLMRHVTGRREYEDVFVPDSVHGTLTADGVGYYDSKILSVSLENAWVVAVYALVGIVLLAVAYALYRRRRSECAGDVVAVGWMKPVFRYGVSVCTAMAGGFALYMVFWGQFQRGSSYDVLPMLLAMILAGAMGYYAATMLLAKSLRVFRGSWKGVAMVALCAAVICGVMKFDVFGIERRVPAAGEIKELTFRAGGNQYKLEPETDAELIEEIRTLHASIAADADYIRNINDGPDLSMEPGEESYSYNTVRLTYDLKNGTTVSRYYRLPVSAQRLAQEGTYDALLDDLVNSDPMKAKRFHLFDDSYTVDGGFLYLELERGGGNSFGTHEARVIHEAVKRDVMAGTCGNYDWFGRSRGDQYAVELSLEFRMERKDENGRTYSGHTSITVAVYPEMTHTVETLLALGLAQEDDLKTYGQLYPQDYDTKYQEYQKFYGDVPYDVYLEMNLESAVVAESAAVAIGGAFEGASSVGIIGGADGPTAIYVTG